MWSDAEIREDIEYHFWAKYDYAREAYGDTADCGYDDGSDEDPVYGCGFTERREAAEAFVVAMKTLRATFLWSDPDNIPF